MLQWRFRWPETSRRRAPSTLTDLVERLHGLDESYQTRVWTLIETWAKTKASDSDKAAMREKIRVSTMSRRAAVRAKKNAKSAANWAVAGKAAYAALEPSDLLNKHAWLFRNGWVEESAEELDDIEKIDFRKRDERIQKMRVDAMREIRDQRGLPALLELAQRGKASWQVGVHAACDLLSDAELVEFLRLALQPILKGEDDIYSFKNVIGGALRAIPDGDRCGQVLKAISVDLSENETVQLLVLAPFGKGTWKHIDALGEAAQAQYWSDVEPNWVRDSDGENNECVERLLKANRPRAAFSCVRLNPEMLDARVLFRLLSAVAAGSNEKSDEYMLDRYNVKQAFKHLNLSPMLTPDQKAALEFAFLDVLAPPGDNRTNGYGIPNLERYIEVHPDWFVHAIVWAFKRKDGGTDPPEFHVPNDHVNNLAMRGRKLLSAIERIPGHDDLGELQADRLARWIATVRQACAELSRTEVADHCIGELLANAPVGKDGVWPCEPVRQVMEDVQSESMMEGAAIGVYNSRGVHFRGEDGNQERELAEQYRKWGQSLQFSHPYVSSMLLMDLARMYENEATREDTEAGIRRRLR